MSIRSRNPFERFKTADVIDWSYAGLFYALGMLTATLIALLWG